MEFARIFDWDIGDLYGAWDVEGEKVVDLFGTLLGIHRVGAGAETLEGETKEFGGGIKLLWLFLKGEAAIMRSNFAMELVKLT